MVPTALSQLRLGAIGLSLAFAFSASSAGAQQSADDLINPDRPGIADGSTTVGLHRLQIETAIQAEFRRQGSEHDRTLFLPTLLRYGVADKWELRLEGNSFTWLRESDPVNGTAHSSGFAPTSIGVKYNFVDASGSEHPSVGAIVRVWSLNPNVGIGVYEDGSSRIYHTGLFAATLNFNPSKVLNLFIDTGIQTREEKRGRTSIIVDAGGAYILGRDIQFDLSIGTGAAGATPPHPFLAAGFSKRF